MAAIYYIKPYRTGVTLDLILKLAKETGEPVKFYDEQGFLKGTAYPNGDVQR